MRLEFSPDGQQDKRCREGERRAQGFPGQMQGHNDCEHDNHKDDHARDQQSTEYPRFRVFGLAHFKVPKRDL